MWSCSETNSEASLFKWFRNIEDHALQSYQESFKVSPINNLAWQKSYFSWTLIQEKYLFYHARLFIGDTLTLFYHARVQPHWEMVIHSSWPLFIIQILFRIIWFVWRIKDFCIYHCACSIEEIIFQDFLVILKYSLPDY